MNAFLKKHSKLISFSHRFLMKFRYFLGIDFRIDFFIVFWWKRVPKWGQNLVLQTPFFGPFSRPCLLCWFYVEFGSLWPPIGHPLAHFWLPLAPFWFPFGSLWLSFASLLGSLGSLWVPFPSFLLTQGSIFSLLLYPVFIFRIFLNFTWKYHAKSDSYKISLAFFERLWLLGSSVWQRHA